MHLLFCCKIDNEIVTKLSLYSDLQNYGCHCVRNAGKMGLMALFNKEPAWKNTLILKKKIGVTNSAWSVGF